MAPFDLRQKRSQAQDLADRDGMNPEKRPAGVRRRKLQPETLAQVKTLAAGDLQAKKIDRRIKDKGEKEKE
jgi:hypothetical protein